MMAEGEGGSQAAIGARTDLSAQTGSKQLADMAVRAPVRRCFMHFGSHPVILVFPSFLQTNEDGLNRVAGEERFEDIRAFAD